jgi:hypothetical protein
MYAPDAKVLVVVFVPCDDVPGTSEQQLAGAGVGAGSAAADFVVLTDGSLPRSFNSVHPV